MRSSMFGKWGKLLIASAILAGSAGFADTSSENSLTDMLKTFAEQALKEAADEKLGDITGKTRGAIEEVKLLERRGNRIVLEVRYEGVKKHDGVYIKGEVLYGGEPLEGFRSSLGQVRHKNGTVRLIISQESAATQSAENDEWGLMETDNANAGAPTIFSDQIKLYMVRENDPETKFGVLLFDLPKTWNGTDTPDATSTASSDTAQKDQNEESVALEEGESEHNKTSNTPVFIPAGTVLKPLPVKKIPVKQSSPKPAGPNVSTTPKPIHMPGPILFNKGTYSLYEHAKDAIWRSAAGKLPFPGPDNDPRGFVRLLPKGHISPRNNIALQMIETHPQYKPYGWIRGDFPPMTLKAKSRFKAVVGFLQGSKSSGAVVTILLKSGKSGRAIKRLHIRPDHYRPISVDLSPWRGKTVVLSLHVSAGKSSAQDWVVWVKPRIVAE